MCPLGGNDIGSIISSARTGNFSGLATLGDDNTATLLSTELANQANLQQARETNEANRQLHKLDNAFNASEAEKSRAFQREMWEAQNNYLTPAQQKQRMLDAGLNPLSLSGLSASPLQSSVPSASPASAASAIPMQSAQIQPAHLSPYSARGVDIAAALTNVANAGKGFADTMVNLRNVRNNEAAQRSQSLLNLAKTVESAQTTSNLKQTHDVLVPANIENIHSEIRRREKQNAESDASIAEKESNIALNNQKREEINQAIVESQARISFMRKDLDWKYYNSNLAAYHSWSGMAGRILEGTSFVSDLQQGVQAITDFVKFFNCNSAKDKASAAWSFVEDVGKKALKSGDERLQLTYSYLKDAANQMTQKWYSSTKSFRNAWYRQNSMVNVGGFSVQNPIPSNGDSYIGQ